MSHVTKEEICDVDGCDKVAERSLNIKKVSETSLILKNPDARSVHLCKDQYKILKKETKGDITLGELADTLQTEVDKLAFDLKNKHQRPQTNASSSISDSWRDMKLP